MKQPHAPALATVKAALRKHADARRAVTARNFFKDTTGEVFWGVPTTSIRLVAKAHWSLPLKDVRALMASAVHDERGLAHAILGLKFKTADEAGQGRIYAFYLKNRGHIRQWNGVDDSAPYIVGPYLMNRSKAVLYQFIRSKKMWDRRIALVATLPMIRQGHVQDTLKLARAVLADREDLIHKASGWMLREVGKKDMPALKKFLKAHHAKMPRTMLRYAIERFPKAERLKYLRGEI